MELSGIETKIKHPNYYNRVVRSGPSKRLLMKPLDKKKRMVNI